jgi:hypothetical protein
MSDMVRSPHSGRVHFKVGAEDLDQIVRTLGARVRPGRGRTPITAHMVLDGFGHEPVDRAAHRGDDLQDIGAGNLGLGAT